ncbi:MAG: PDZ domain-containing protein [Pseudomonadota bacterium]
MTLTAPPHYTVLASDLQAHLFEVRCDLGDVRDAVEMRMPAWIRGSYLVRDFAKHVTRIEATRGSTAVAIARTDKNSFRIQAGDGALVLRWWVYAYDESVRKAYLDARRGFFNGSSLFFQPVGWSGGCTLDISAPSDSSWKLATTLKPLKVDARGFGRYTAADYEDLIDHPVEMGDFQRVDFVAADTPHAFILSGRCEADGARLAADAKKICEAQHALFRGEPKLDQYLFLTRVVGSGYGGLEHRSSTALICSRNDLPRQDMAGPSTELRTGLPRDYRTFLGLVSHEYFHLWNVKRITAKAFSDSDLAAEAYTRDLWHYEGVTSYYDDLFLLRAGLLDAATYLDLLAETATRLERAPGRLQHTLADASFETWVKYYQPDENSPNATTNYYVKGALAALCLDLHLRLHSQSTLDDVMRVLWARYGSKNIGVPEGGLEAVAQEICGLDLKPQFDAWLRSTAELPVAELLAAFGIKAERRAAISEADTGGRVSGKPLAAALGLRLRGNELAVAHVVNGRPAERAGLAGGDVLVALDGYKLTPGNWSLRSALLAAGRKVPLHYFRGDELFETSITPEAAPLDTWTFTLADADAQTLARRKTWLSC